MLSHLGRRSLCGAPDPTVYELIGQGDEALRPVGLDGDIVPNIRQG